MSEAKHTPGPWTASQQKAKDGRDLGWIIESDPRTPRVLHRTAGRLVEYRDRIGWSSYADAATNEGDKPPYLQSGANARLMAAAPDLLEACKICASICEEGDTGASLERVVAAMQSASLAIAKAEGR